MAGKLRRRIRFIVVGKIAAAALVAVSILAQDLSQQAAEAMRTGRYADAERFYHDVAHALDGVEEILVTGPAAAKLEFIKYVHKSHHTLVPKIVGVETVDHPTDKQLVAYARHYFRAADKMR